MNIFSLGTGFVSQHLPYNNISERIEINSSCINKILDKYKPDVLINCIGKTGTPNIDWCESNRLITSLTNTILPILLADACYARNIHLIHVGSGCIFYGTSPHIKYYTSIDNKHLTVDFGWRETDFANPLGFYSKSKYAADLNIAELPNVTILRIRMPISKKKHPRNLINKLIGYSRIIDIPNSMTFMDDFVKCVDWVAKNNKTGIFHVTNPQPLSALEIMTEYKKYNPNHNFEVISEGELDKLTIAKRSNCILDCTKLRNSGFQMSLSSDALTDYMKEYCNTKVV